jgi:hypothetical protein
MKPKSAEPDLSKPPSGSGLRQMPRPGEPPRVVPGQSAANSSQLPTRPTTGFAATDLSLTVISSGKLTWRTVLAWLRDDKILSAQDIERTAHRFAGSIRWCGSAVPASRGSATARCSTPRRSPSGSPSARR